MVCVAKCSQIKQNMVNLEASSRSEVSCQVTGCMNRGFLMNFSGLSLWFSLFLAHPFMFNTHYLLFPFSGYPSDPSTSPSYIPSLVVSHVEPMFFSLPVILLSSITSPSRSITTTRRLWSCARRTPKTVTSGWLPSRRPGTFFPLDLSPSSTNGNVLKAKESVTWGCVWQVNGRCSWMYAFRPFLKRCSWELQLRKSEFIFFPHFDSFSRWRWRFLPDAVPQV